ncbi:SGNH hydrolase-type esterase domain-containing protein [Hyaloraphidium curvatum]|nr:SGNH hydrolase-type esterase domain-containing protein [Hyaloraphidium curvatum]
MAMPRPNVVVPAPLPGKTSHGYIEYAEHKAYEDDRRHVQRRTVVFWIAIACATLAGIAVGVGATIGLMMGRALPWVQPTPTTAPLESTTPTASDRSVEATPTPSPTTAAPLGLPGVTFPLLTSLSILALGDSLTAGQHSQPVEYTPYGDTLREELRNDTRLAGINITVDVEGVPGDMVNGGFPSRLIGRLDQEERNGAYYTHVVVLGGVNDINLNHSSAEHVFSGLQNLYNITLQRHRNTQVIACTILENEFQAKKADYAARDATRKEVNKRLREEFGERAVPRVSLLDLETLMPYESLSDWDKYLYFDDKLHLTKMGYVKLGDLVYDHIIRLLASAV